MRIFRILILFVFPFLILASAGVLFFLNQTRSALSVYGDFPDFSLTSQTGKEVGASNLKGRPFVASFIFTRCQGQCPIITAQMNRLEREVKGLQLVSFSVDPEFDSPAVLSQYARHFNADPGRWLFLTGARDVLNRVTTGLHMNKIDDPMFHSASLVLADSKGKVRGYYDANDAERVEKLKRDAGGLMKKTNLLFLS